MLVVYYKLPGEIGEDVLVMERPYFESHLALLFTEHDEGLPFFYMSADSEKVVVEPSTAPEPYYTIYHDGFEGVLPARNQAEARDWARNFNDRLKQHAEREEV